MDPGARSRGSSADPGAIENGQRLTRRLGQISIYAFLRRAEGRTRHLSRFDCLDRDVYFRHLPIARGSLHYRRRHSQHGGHYLPLSAGWFCSMLTRSPTTLNVFHVRRAVDAHHPEHPFFAT